MYRKSEKGFSLIELLVAVAILGLLAGLVVPRVIAAVNHARTNADAANVALIQAALDRMAIDDNLRTIPRWSTALGRTAANPMVIGTAVTMDTAMWTALEDYVVRAVTHPLGGTYTVTLQQPGGTGNPVVAIVASVIP